MKHYVHVGRFAAILPFRVIAPLTWEEIYPILLRHCTAEHGGRLVDVDGVPNLLEEKYAVVIAYIAHEPIYARRGYLACPWLNAGEVRESLELAVELAEQLDLRIDVHDDGRICTPSEFRREYMDW
jgi:hypothetical protein